jgi:hypothetical protein
MDTGNEALEEGSVSTPKHRTGLQVMPWRDLLSNIAFWSCHIMM